MNALFKKLIPIMLTASMVTACGGATAKQQTVPEKKTKTEPELAMVTPVNTKDGSKYIPVQAAVWPSHRRRLSPLTPLT